MRRECETLAHVFAFSFWNIHTQHGITWNRKKNDANTIEAVYSYIYDNIHSANTRRKNDDGAKEAKENVTWEIRRTKSGEHKYGRNFVLYVCVCNSKGV